MALIPEDGSGNVSGANSYASFEQILAYALARGILLPSSPADQVEAMAFQAMDYLASLEDRYRGTRTYELDQPLSWPRTDVQIYGFDFPEDAIPENLISAQCQLVIEVHNGVNLFPTQTPSTAVKREKVDVIETEYFSASEMGGSLFFQPIISSVNSLLAPLLKTGFGPLRNIRV